MNEPGMNETTSVPTMNLVGLAMQLQSRTMTAQQSFEEAKDRMARHLAGAPDSFFIQAAKDLARTAEAFNEAKEAEKLVTGALGAEAFAKAMGLLNQAEGR